MVRPSLVALLSTRGSVSTTALLVRSMCVPMSTLAPQVLELAFQVLMYFFVGAVPERPLWLRRLVQAFWAVVALLFVVGCVLGVVYLVEAL